MKPIQVHFKPSVILIGMIIAASFASCLTLILMPLMWQVKLPIICIILLFAMHSILHHGLFCMPSSVLGLKVDIKNELYVVRKDRRELKVQLVADTVVTPYLVVMNFNEPNTAWYQRLFNHALIVLADSTDAEDFRQLRVWLRWADVAGNTSEKKSKRTTKKSGEIKP